MGTPCICFWDLLKWFLEDLLMVKHVFLIISNFWECFVDVQITSFWVPFFGKTWTSIKWLVIPVNVFSMFRWSFIFVFKYFFYKKNIDFCVIWTLIKIIIVFKNVFSMFRWRMFFPFFCSFFCFFWRSVFNSTSRRSSKSHMNNFVFFEKP